jgi:hypothetical protein
MVATAAQWAVVVAKEKVHHVQRALLKPSAQQRLLRAVPI